MKHITEFAPADRYIYDFKHCTTSNGWAQLDTAEDASYFGNWINPFDLKLFCYCEGDTTLDICETPEEFVSHVRQTFQFYAERETRRPGIDPGFNEELKARFIELGLGDLLH